jgi:hypothetical protein
MDMALGFVIGLAVGGMLGLFIAPAVHAWLGRLEWKAATREIELTDRLLESLEVFPDPETREHQSNGNPKVAALPDGHAH